MIAQNDSYDLWFFESNNQNVNSAYCNDLIHLDIIIFTDASNKYNAIFLLKDVRFTRICLCWILRCLKFHLQIAENDIDVLNLCLFGGKWTIRHL